MRTNRPVTAEEYRFPADLMLVSTTDPQGRILYGNAAFIEVSGFGKDELLGRPHNLVRHPDMPEEAFRDMWATLKGGQPWNGLVKNRRKNGSFYWVQANVTPLVSGGAIVGYLSVRVVPDDAAVRAAEQLYARMRAEQAAGAVRATLRAGVLVSGTLPSRLGQVLRMGPTGRVAAASAAAAAAAAAGLATLVAAGAAPPVLAGAALVGAAGVAGCTALAVRTFAITPIARLVSAANQLAAGDLTVAVRVHGHGEVAALSRALRQLSVNLRAVVGDARREVRQMSVATAEIAAGNQDLSARTESQAANLQQTAASMQQITDTVRQGVDSATQASTLAGRTRETTEAGSRAMNAVRETVLGITESSAKIGEIIGVIESIAFQTNILALNAAVEAARAGEEGRGFAVVAAEVRALAQRTSGAAREVRELIRASADQVAGGAALSREAQQTIGQVRDEVQRVTGVIHSMASASSEQLAGISQGNEAVTQLDTITQRNAALVEQVAVAAVDLRRQAQSVSDAMSVFAMGESDSAKPDAVALRRAARSGAREQVGV
jgi:aerotaxis receptor